MAIKKYVSCRIHMHEKFRKRVQLVKNGESASEINLNRSCPNRSTTMRKLFDKTFAPLLQIFLGRMAKMCFSSQYFLFLPYIDRNFAFFFYMNCSGSEEHQKFFFKIFDQFFTELHRFKNFERLFCYKIS